jgi:hypothetical protein
VHIGAADGNSLDPHQDLVVAELRLRNIQVFELQRRSVDQGFHGVPLLKIGVARLI